MMRGECRQWVVGFRASPPAWAAAASSGDWVWSRFGSSDRRVGWQGGCRSCRSRSWNHLGRGRTADLPRFLLPPPSAACTPFPFPSASSPLHPCSHTAIFVISIFRLFSASFSIFLKKFKKKKKKLWGRHVITWPRVSRINIKYKISKFKIEKRNEEQKPPEKKCDCPWD